MFSSNRGNKFQLASIIYFIIGNLLFGLMISLSGFDVGIITSILVSQFLMVGATVIVYIFLTKASLVKDLYVKPLSWLDVLICIGIAWTIMPILSFINVLSQFVVKNQIEDVLVEMLDIPFLITLILTAVFPAILEELLSRSIILRNYQRRTVLTTCLLSGMFFGFIHLNINQFLYAFVMGVLMCYIVMITDSVLSAMVIHFTINATGTITLYLVSAVMKVFDASGVALDQMMSPADPTTGQLLISLAMVFFMVLLFTPVAYLLIRQLMKRHHKRFDGSWRMITSEFMRRHVEVPTHSFSEDILLAEKTDIYEGDLSEEKIQQWPLVLSGILFLLFAMMVEITSRMVA